MSDAVNAVIAKMEEAMKDRLAKMGKDMSNMRTGRANPMMLESVKVEAYGSLVPLKQVAAVSVPEARTLEIRPWDPSTLQDLEKALQKADIGAMPQNDGKMLRISLPMMTEDRRKDLVKSLKKLGEEFKVGVRNERQDALNKVKKSFQAKEITEDALRLHETRIQKLTDAFTKQIEDSIAVKEKEILTV
ncbi:MAG: ribosome recycling factor [Elusimicrobia bacterium]|nr:ribosome recycling factor [Elusimicrobiota bacterium]